MAPGPGGRDSFRPLHIPMPPDLTGPADKTPSPAAASGTLASQVVQAMRAKQWLRADRLLEQLLLEEPNNRDAAIALIQVRIQGENVRGAMAAVARFQACYAGDAEMQLLFGRAFLAADRPEQAIYAMKLALALDTQLPDAHLLLGSIYLSAKQPLNALDALQDGRDSSEHASQLRRMTMATALAQTGQLETARQMLEAIRRYGASRELCQTAQRNLVDIDKLVFGPGRSYGYVKATQRYDDNTGVVPTTNEFGGFVSDIDSLGGLVTTQFNYDLFRDYQRSLSAGYSGLLTYNYDDIASQFNVQNHAAHLLAVTRTRTPGSSLPLTGTVRCDFSDVATDGVSFLNRYGMATAWTVQDSDFHSTTGQVSISQLDFLNQPPGSEASRVDSDSNVVEFAFYRNWQDARRWRTHTLGYAYTQNTAEGSEFDYLGHRLIAACAFHRRDTAQLRIQIQLAVRDYDSVHSLAPVERNDAQLIAHLIYSRPLNDSLLFVAECAYYYNDSSLVTSQYDRTVVEVGLQWNFRSRSSAIASR